MSVFCLQKEFLAIIRPKCPLMQALTGFWVIFSFPLPLFWSYFIFVKLFWPGSIQLISRVGGFDPFQGGRGGSFLPNFGGSFLPDFFYS